MAFDFGVTGQSKAIGGPGGGLIDAFNYFTGNTPEARMKSFVDAELPAIANDIHAASTVADVQKHAQRFIAAGLKAGIQPQQLDKLGDMLITPALNNLGANELSNLRKELSPSTTFTDTPTKVGLPAIEGPLGPGLEASEAASLPFSVRTKPGRDFGQADALKLAELEARTGIKPPQGLASLLVTPSTVAQHEASASSALAEASKRKTEESIAARKLKVLEDLPETPIGETGISARALGLATGGSGLTSLIPQREKSETELDKQLKQSQIARNQATATRTKAAAGGAGEMKPAQLIALRNSLRAQLQAANAAFDDEEAAALQEQLSMVDDEIQKKGKILFKPDKEGATPAKGTAAKKPTIQSVKAKFGIK
jgi:hypothetical protein